MKGDPIYELHDIDKVRIDDEETLRIVFEQITQSTETIEEFYDKIRKVSERISMENMSEGRKRLILYRYLASLFSGMIGYTLTIDGAIAVTKSILEGFETTANMIQHERESKVDRFPNKKFK